MTDSGIKYGEGATTFHGPDGVAFYRAAVLASALKLYAQTGMKPNRAYTPTAMLKAASQITGKTYKRGQHMQASDDLKAWAQEMKAALPHTNQKGEPI